MWTGLWSFGMPNATKEYGATYTNIVKFALDWKYPPAHAAFPMAISRAQTSEKQDDGLRVLDVTGVKVFSATKAKERELLGEIITDWIRSNPNYDIVDKIVTQSSDSEFHCLTITLFYKHNKA